MSSVRVTTSCAQDVAFSAVLCNGRPIDEARRVPIAWGDAVRLRVVNGAGTTSFRVRFGVDVDVIALDGSLIHVIDARARHCHHRR